MKTPPKRFVLKTYYHWRKNSGWRTLPHRTLEKSSDDDFTQKEYKNTSLDFVTF
ncbi:MAG: hypothetical protein ACK4GN_02960 [Runella sp.]